MDNQQWFDYPMKTVEDVFELIYNVIFQFEYTRARMTNNPDGSATLTFEKEEKEECC